MIVRVADFLYKALERSYESDVRGGVSISQIGYCGLKTQKFHNSGTKPSISVDRLLAMKTGTATHEYLMKLLWEYRGEIENFIYKKREMEVSITSPKGHNLRGHLDLLAEVDGELEVIDFKIVDQGPFSYINGPESRIHDYTQINCYARAAGVKNCRLVYVCKGGKATTAEVKEYPFAVDDAIVDKSLAKFDAIMEGTAVKEFSRPDESWECNICQFYTECWGAKVYMQKQDGVAPIDEELEKKYIIAKEDLDNIKTYVDELRDIIASSLDGKRGEGSRLSAFFTPPSICDQYDSAMLRKLVSPDILAKCSKKVEKSGFYRINVRGE